MQFSHKEIIDILKAWIAISVAFAILIGGFSLSSRFLVSLLIAALTVGFGFVLHELAHKIVAQHYHIHAEFRSFDFMLVLAVVMAFAGFILAAPGAVMMSGRPNKHQNGIISAAGIGASLLAALLFFFLSFVTQGHILLSIAHYGTVINSWLAVFNLIPIAMFDGSKVFRWNKPIYVGLATLAIVLLLAGGSISV